MKARALVGFLVIVAVAVGVAPAGAGEVDDIVVLRGPALYEARFAIPDAGVEDVEHASVFAGIAGEYATLNLVACAPTAQVYAHQTQRDLSPVAIALGRDVVTAVGNCASPLIAQLYDVEVGIGVFKYNSVTRKFDILLWQAKSPSPLPAVAGQGANFAAGVHAYAYNTYPLGFVRGCSWFTKPINTYDGRDCAPPDPVI